MDSYTDGQTKKEPFQDVEEFSSEYDSDRHSSMEDLPLFEAKPGHQDTLERALVYSKDLVAKGEYPSRAMIEVIDVLIVRS